MRNGRVPTSQAVGGPESRGNPTVNLLSGPPRIQENLRVQKVSVLEKGTEIPLDDLGQGDKRITRAGLTWSTYRLSLSPTEEKDYGIAKRGRRVVFF